MSYGDNGEAILMTEGGVKLSGVISFDLSVQAGARRGGEMSVRLVSGGFRP